MQTGRIVARCTKIEACSGYYENSFVLEDTRLPPVIVDEPCAPPRRPTGRLTLPTSDAVFAVGKRYHIVFTPATDTEVDHAHPPQR